MSEYNGYNLFNDIEDDQLRRRNQAVVMYNIIEAHTGPNGKVSNGGLVDLLQYTRSISSDDRAASVAMLRLMVKGGTA